MQRYDIIQHLIKKRGYSSYLEIGVLNGDTLNHIGTPVKHGVDPNGRGTFAMTSDEFFARHCAQSYDIIFIDGLHLAEQVTRDIRNSLTHLNQGGIIVMHDCLPMEEYQQLREGISGKPWTGDVWKAFVGFRMTRHDLKMCVVDTDYGCGLIERGESAMYIPDGYLDWSYFERNRNIMMNVITVEEFLNGYS